MSIETITAKEFKQFNEIRRKEESIRQIKLSREYDKNALLALASAAALTLSLGIWNVATNYQCRGGRDGVYYLLGLGSASALGSICYGISARNKRRRIQEDTSSIEQMRKNLGEKYGEMEEITD